MPELAFTIEGAEAQASSAAPAIDLHLRIDPGPGEDVVALALACQVRIETRRRVYSGAEKENLEDLFGAPSRWGKTLAPLLWAQTGALALDLEGETRVKLALPCSFDLEVASAKYLHALEGGEVPIKVLFSGTVVSLSEEGAPRITRVPWDREASFRLPVEVWRRAIDAHFPGEGYVRLRRDTLERLDRYRRARGLPTWEATLERLLASEASEREFEPERGSQRRPGLAGPSRTGSRNGTEDP